MTKVLIIDDDDNVRESIEDILSDNGFSTLMAINGADGIQKAKEFRPDIIVCDIMMPGMSGYEVVQEIRKDKDLLTTPFIFLTGKVEERDKRYGMNLTVDDYLTKPFREQDLLESIQARLKRKNQFDSNTLEKVKEAKSELNKLNVQRKFLASVLQISPEGIYIYDVSLKRIIFYNSPFSKIMASVFPNEDFEEINNLDSLDRVLLLRNISDSQKDLYEHDSKIKVDLDKHIWLSIKAKPFKTDDTGNVLQYIGIVQDITEKKEKELLIQDFYNNISKQLEVAQITQSFLVAEKFPDYPKYSFYHYYKAMDNIGGDFLDYKETNEDVIDIILGDVSGHGVSAALVSTMANLIFKMSDPSKYYLEKMFYHLHESLQFLSDAHYITSVILRLDTKLDVLYYSYAGHPPALLIRGDQVIKLNGRGHLLMLIPEPNFDLFFTELEQGDKILIYSDGLYEVYKDGENDTLLGLEEFMEWVGELSQESPESLVDKLLERISKYSNNKVNDDMTVLCIEKK